MCLTPRMRWCAEKNMINYYNLNQFCVFSGDSATCVCARARLLRPNFILARDCARVLFMPTQSAREHKRHAIQVKNNALSPRKPIQATITQATHDDNDEGI